MDFNLLIQKLSTIEDVLLRDSLKDWVAHTMMPKIVQHDVVLNFTEDQTIDCDGISVGGYFAADGSATLSLALGAETWMETLIHEFCHLTQWADYSPAWNSGILDEQGTEASVLVDYWFAGLVELNSEQLDAYFGSMIEVELDCEIRSVKMIRKHKIPFNLKLYIQRANAYVLCYHEYRRRRTWNIPGKAPYLIPSIVEAMPTDFESVDYYDKKTITPKLKRLYNECFEGA
jgi:hypothetical protein